MDFNEQIYLNKYKDIKYVFEEGNVNRDYLVIVFSGFATAGSTPPYKYNYIRTLRQIDCHKLFILDNDGPRGSYYLGNNMTFNFEKGVAALIEEKLKQTGVNKENVITVGSSKGGSAALYYGLKYGYGYVVSGAPQVRIADYILRFNEGTAEHMLGSRDNKRNIDRLNEIILEALKLNKNKTKIFLLSSKNDTLHNSHSAVLVDSMKMLDFNFDYTEDNSIKNHNEIALYFPDYLITELLKIMFAIEIKQISFDIKDNQYILSTNVLSSQDIKEMIQFNDVEISHKEYTKDYFYLNNMYPSLVKINYLITTQDGTIYKKPLRNVLVNEDNQVCVPKLEKNSDFLYFNMRFKTKINNIQYAFYIYRNGKLLKKIMYQSKDWFEYVIPSFGKYFVKYFILLPNGKKLVDKSNIIQVE